jgi:ABC-type nitrate/sulfonate/bicarbonate transport system permease component
MPVANDMTAQAGGSRIGEPLLARRRRALRWRPWLLAWAPGILSCVVLLGLLELITVTGIVDKSAFPLVSTDIAVFFEHVGDGSFWSAVGDTVEGWGIGLLVAIGIGIGIGTALGISRRCYVALRAVIEFLRSVPPVALIPLAVLLYGRSLRSTVFLVVIGAVWPVIVQTTYGMQAVDPVAIDTARSFSIGPLGRLWHVRLPSALPYIATGIRVSSAIAFVMAVTAELVIASPGLGDAINVARQGDAIEYAYALLLATGLVGLALNSALSLAERRLLRWHPSQRKRSEQAA